MYQPPTEDGKEEADPGIPVKIPGLTRRRLFANAQVRGWVLLLWFGLGQIFEWEIK